MSQTARDAQQKLEALNPERAKEIKVPETASPMSGMPVGVSGGPGNQPLNF